MFSSFFSVPAKGKFHYREYTGDIGKDLAIDIPFFSNPKVSYDGVTLKHLEGATHSLVDNSSIQLRLDSEKVQGHAYGIEVVRDGQLLSIYIIKLWNEIFGTYHLTLTNDAGLKSSYTFSITQEKGQYVGKPIPSRQN